MRRLFLLLPLVVGPALATEQTFTSRPQPVALLELFTSEGCSSCPPAERWMAEQRSEAGLWRDFVPVTWHVDYWNGLGWKDRFSSPAHTQRQYAYAKAWGSGNVYTPCFVRNGREWRRDGAISSGGPAVGALVVHYDGRTVRAKWDRSAGAPGELELNVAILGGGIRSRVTAGENSGRMLTHEFVVLTFASGRLGEDVALVAPETEGVTRRALAAWVTRRGSEIPLQAVGGWLE